MSLTHLFNPLNAELAPPEPASSASSVPSPHASSFTRPTQRDTRGSNGGARGREPCSVRCKGPNDLVKRKAQGSGSLIDARLFPQIAKLWGSYFK